MKDNTLKIVINRSASDVLKFTAEPDNTPKWIDSIVHEEVDRRPIGVGTIYRNTNQEGTSTEYEMIEFEPHKTFALQQKDSPYFVRYTFNPIDASTTEFTYHEWMDEGDLEAPFPQSCLDKLKQILGG